MHGLALEPLLQAFENMELSVETYEARVLSFSFDRSLSIVSKLSQLGYFTVSQGILLKGRKKLFNSGRNILIPNNVYQ